MTTTNSAHSSITTDAIHALCQRLQLAVMKCRDYHVFLQYAPHVNALTVYAHLLGFKYTPDETRPRIFSSDIYLDEENALVKLQAVVGELQRLGVEV